MLHQLHEKGCSRSKNHLYRHRTHINLCNSRCLFDLLCPWHLNKTALQKLLKKALQKFRRTRTLALNFWEHTSRTRFRKQTHSKNLKYISIESVIPSGEAITALLGTFLAINPIGFGGLIYRTVFLNPLSHTIPQFGWINTFTHIY